MSFSCPHFCPDEEHCLRLKTDCVPGRPGCVLPKTTGFAVSAEERVREKERERAERNRDQLPEWPPKAPRG